MLKLLLYGVQAEVVALLNEEYGFEYMEDVHWEDVLRGDMQVGQAASSGRCCSRECFLLLRFLRLLRAACADERCKACLPRTSQSSDWSAAISTRMS